MTDTMNFLSEKLILAQSVKIFFRFFRIGKFIIVSTRSGLWTLSWARRIQSTSWKLL